MIDEATANLAIQTINYRSASSMHGSPLRRGRRHFSRNFRQPVDRAGRGMPIEAPFLDVVILHPGSLGFVLGNGGGDEGGHDTSAVSAGMGKHVPHEVDAATLPVGV
jgi:hypothetical protein